MIPFKDNVGAAGVPAVTIALIVLCVLTFGWQLTLSGADGTAAGRSGDLTERDEFAAKYGTSPAEIARTDEDPRVDGVTWWSSPVTAFIASADLLHLAINLLFLWIFGRTIELTLGRPRFGVLLVLTAFAAIGVMALADHDSTGLVLGTANVLAGILGAYAVLYGRAAVLSLTLVPLFATLLEVPALLLIAAWFLLGLVPTVGNLVDPGLLGGGGLEYLGFAAAFAVGWAGGLLARSRRIVEPRAMPV